MHPANKLFYLTCQSCQQVSDEVCGGRSIPVGRLVLPVKICDGEAVLIAKQLLTPEHFACKSLGLMVEVLAIQIDVTVHSDSR